MSGNVSNSEKYHMIKRDKIYEDVLEVYTDNLEVLNEYPLRIKFEGEKAFDCGGVCREMFSCFWKLAYQRHFDGDRLLVPSVCPGMQISLVTTLGTILSHGYLVCGFLPIRLAFPVIASALKGPYIKISDAIMLESFFDYISMYESSLLKKALILAKQGVSFSDDIMPQLIQLTSRFECTVIPQCHNLRQIIVDISRHVFLGKPMGLLYALHGGVPQSHRSFWSQFAVEKLFDLFRALNATPSVVLRLIEEPEFENRAEAKIFYYLTSYIGNSKQNELRSFLRFVTGSSVVLGQSIKISFNSLHGLARRPIAHTCDCQLDLPTTYSNYPDFEKEFDSILAQDDWTMDAV